MIISTKGRYALRSMLDLAVYGGEGFTPLKETAQRQDISQKYLESIMVLLSRAGLVAGAHGKGGGYRLTRAPEEYTVGEILRLTEGPLLTVACQDDSAIPCERRDDCLTRPMWDRLQTMLDGFFDSITLADLLSGDAPEV